MKHQIAVVGIGNVLLSDDGLGPYVIKRIDSAFVLGANAALVEAGTPGLDLTALFYGFDELIIVDTVRVQGRPGEIRKFDRETLIKKSPVLSVSPHDPGLREALLTLQMTQERPQEVTLIGVIPENLELGTELSHSVEQAVPQVIAEVLAELERFGVTAQRRLPPGELDIWWKKAVQ
jgi:hydrogenase maturation protease